MADEKKNMTRRPGSFKKWETHQHREERRVVEKAGKRRRDSGRSGRPLCVVAGRADGTRFRPAVSAGIRRACPCTVVCSVSRHTERRRVGRARVVKARQREVACPTLFGVAGAARRHPLAPASFSHAAAPGSARRAAPLRLVCATPSVRGHPRSDDRLFLFFSRYYEYLFLHTHTHTHEIYIFANTKERNDMTYNYISSNVLKVN